jgi:hypothetical protein
MQSEANFLIIYHALNFYESTCFCFVFRSLSLNRYQQSTIFNHINHELCTYIMQAVTGAVAMQVDWSRRGQWAVRFVVRRVDQPSPAGPALAGGLLALAPSCVTLCLVLASSTLSDRAGLGVWQSSVECRPDWEAGGTLRCPPRQRRLLRPPSPLRAVWKLADGGRTCTRRA